VLQPAVFLDRDDTLIHNDGDLADPAGVCLIQGAASAVASLCGLGYKIVVITNQGGVARGKFTEKDVEATHQHIAQLVEKAANGARIDAFYYCPYHPEGTVKKYTREHPNRKPQPGMLLDAAREMRLDLSRSWTIGDQLRDVQAGAAASTRTILLGDEEDQSNAANHHARTLVEAVRIIAKQRDPELASRSPGHPTLQPVDQRKWDAAAVAQLQKTAKPPPPESVNTSNRQPKPFQPWNLPPPPEIGPRVSDAPSDIPHSPPPGISPSSPKPQASSLPPSPSLKTLKQILQELRNQRVSGQGDFSYLTVIAIVMQMVVGVCLLGGLWMGAGDFELFMRWVLSGLIVQGATIVLLLFAGRH